MIRKSHALFLAAGLMAAPLAPALAQSNPTGNLGSNKSATAAPGTADDPAMSTMHTGDANGTTTRPYGTTAMNRHAPGATGNTVVKGTTSTQAGSKATTNAERAGTITTGGGNK